MQFASLFDNLSDSSSRISSRVKLIHFKNDLAASEESEFFIRCSRCIFSRRRRTLLFLPRQSAISVQSIILLFSIATNHFSQNDVNVIFECKQNFMTEVLKLFSKSSSPCVLEDITLSFTMASIDFILSVQLRFSSSILCALALLDRFNKLATSSFRDTHIMCTCVTANMYMKQIQ